MKNRILLILVRWYEALDKPLPQWLERACDSDTSLGLDLDEEREFTNALKEKPDWNPVPPNPYMAERILACLNDDEPREAPRTMWREVTIGIAACVAIALAYQWAGSLDSSNGDAFVAENPVESVDEEGSLLDDIPLLAANSDWKNPLDQELEYVLDDAKGALDFLAASFVPQSMRAMEQEG